MTDEAPEPTEAEESSHEHADGSAHTHSGGDVSHHHHGDETHDHAGGDEHHHHHGELAHDHQGGDEAHEHNEAADDVAADDSETATEHSHSEEPPHDHEDGDQSHHHHEDGTTHDHAEGDESHHHHEDGTTHDHAEGDESHHHHEDGTTHDHADGTTDHSHQTDVVALDSVETEAVSESGAAEVDSTDEEGDVSTAEEESIETDEEEDAAEESTDDQRIAAEQDSDETDEVKAEAEDASESEDDGDAFEVRLVGGLSVLKDSHDPLYVMQAVTNLASTLIITWAMVALVWGWKDGDVANNGWWVLLAVILGLTVVLVVVLEAFLSHDRILQQKMENFSRWTQYIMAAWLVGLFIWSNDVDGPDLRGAEPLLEMTVVWVLLFTATEFVNRFKLGKMKWKGGRDVMSLISSSLGGVSSLVTGAEIKQMKASSRSVMEGIRWVLDFCSLLFFLMIVILTSASTGSTMEDALTHLPMGLDSYGLDVVVKPALWLGSVYLLIFLSETWLRLRPE